jgi:putative transposase
MELLCDNRHMNMLIQKAYRYRLYPNSTQQNQLAVNFGHARFVYNFFLAQRIQFYEENRGSEPKKGLNDYDNANELSAMKRSAELEWLKDAHSQVLQQSLKDLDRAYQNFFKKRAKFPRFHSKHGKQAIRYPQGVQISEKHIRAPQNRLGKGRHPSIMRRQDQKRDRFENQVRSLFCQRAGRDRCA